MNGDGGGGEKTAFVIKPRGIVSPGVYEDVRPPRRSAYVSTPTVRRDEAGGRRRGANARCS